MNPYNKTDKAVVSAAKTVKKAVAPQQNTLYGKRTSLAQGVKDTKKMIKNAKNPWSL